MRLHRHDAIHLPEPLARRLDKLAESVMTPPGIQPDFQRPRGEPALVPADSISWQVFKNPVALFVGGTAAVLLELAEPRVREGVWRHSSFRTDALTRLQRTGMAAMVTVYGARSVAEQMIANVNHVHEKIRGTTKNGQVYAASDPELLAWVQATATFGFLTAYSRYVGTLSPFEMDRGVAEAAVGARLYGVQDPPTSRAELETLFSRFDPLLERSPIIREFLDIMCRVKAFPRPLRFLQRQMLKAAVSLLPGELQLQLGLGGWRLPALERRIIRAVGRSSERLVLRAAPPAQACRRLGLPADWLYR